MNAPLRRVAISVLVLFTLLIVNVNVIQVVRSDELRSDGRNTRVLVEEYDSERGSMVVGGTEVANSVPTDDQLTYLRQYANGPVYAPVTGYYSLVYGNWQLERAADDVLSGDDARLFTRRLADLFTGRDPSGGDVVLTLDTAVQETAMAGLEGVTGAVVALDPSTGAVLGLASTPTYDPNQLSSHEPAAIREYAEGLEALEIDPRLNRAIDARYSPGSIFKVVVSAAALADGQYTSDTVIPAPQELVLPGTSTPLENFGGSACDPSGRQSLLDALTVSCNTAFAQLGIDLGEDRVRQMAEAFGIDGEGFDIPLTVADSTLGEIENDAQLGVSSIGQQDVQLTPLQAAMIASAVANDGTLMSPYLVDQVRAPDLSVIDQTDPEELSEPVSAEVADQLTEMMTSVVENGSGRRARIPGVTVAGKTGTAENAGPDHNWFIGFAPADDPQIAVAVFVANGGGTGGDVSAPIARDVMQAYLDGQGG
ncbi:cell elongation-specific peptidoglycan D,D-transpeptidase [Geodermatophilus africanus]|uniref:Cell elongation-specific peptidoglycan D,D-transpeptidase n=1 Tax=Geodermatophilus africanus TaxID=1137993 RepID=A0A1H3L0P3_9ACTN|nr:penicillin-binding protein 2 [Geodermatophilus africanus]SDY57799.1 cell elongation-specific peptidoglycan D,D-transpeptidase [Geodermatophilus africanus]SDY96501.1 cell elongation-specific peptidoglycan D,D-transpeptidase [Geodermatophilus africanus]